MKPPAVHKPLSPAEKIVYLSGITLGLAFMITGVLWLVQLGCAVVISAQLWFGRFTGPGGFTKRIGYCIALFALTTSGWFFSMAYRGGNVWQRTPPPWWWVGFIFLVWASGLFTELRRKQKS